MEFIVHFWIVFVYKKIIEYNVLIPTTSSSDQLLRMNHCFGFTYALVDSQDKFDSITTESMDKF